MSDYRSKIEGYDEPVILADSTNLELWLAALDDPANQQVRGRLGTAFVDGFDPDEPETTAHCCLGLGCKVAGYEFRLDNVNYDPAREDDEPGRLANPDAERPTDYSAALLYKDPNTSIYQESLPPLSFLVWLGIINEDELAYILASTSQRMSDVYVDIPSGAHWYDLDLTGAPMSMYSGCAAMNDTAGLTFPQIADMIRYFGLLKRAQG